MIKSVITQLVKSSEAHSQLQSVKFVQVADFKWIVELFFYPEPGYLVLTQESAQIGKSKLFKGVASQKHPLQLYLNAHLKNRRVAQVLSEDGAESVEFKFLEDKELFLKIICKPKSLECEFVVGVAGRKPFSKTLKMGKLQLEEKEQKEADSSLRKIEKRYTRLLSNVQKDFSSAEKEFSLSNSIYEKVLADFNAWGNDEEFTTEEREWIKKKIATKALPSFLSQYAGRSFGLLKSFGQKAQIKMKKSQKRLSELEKNREETLKDLTKKISEKNKDNSPKSLHSKKKKAPGRWVELSGGLLAKVGKSAQENDDMFRYFKDRDMWFHVKNYPGAHVWVPRGQKFFPKKGDLSPQHVLEACQLALFNSRAPRLSKVVVDFTEKRYLRKVPGQIGLMTIMKSETRMIDWDESLEEKFKNFKK